MEKIPLTKQEVRARGIPLPQSRGWTTEYYELDNKIYCRRGTKHYTELLVFCYGLHPLLKQVCLYWDSAVQSSDT